MKWFLTFFLVLTIPLMSNANERETTETDSSEKYSKLYKVSQILLIGLDNSDWTHFSENGKTIPTISYIMASKKVQNQQHFMNNISIYSYGDWRYFTAQYMSRPLIPLDIPPDWGRKTERIGQSLFGVTFRF